MCVGAFPTWGDPEPCQWGMPRYMSLIRQGLCYPPPFKMGLDIPG